MGTISDKLMRIINTKEDIRQALISKGCDVPTSIPFKEYAKMILDLPCKADSFPDIEGIVARYSASGITNEQMAANPVWVDKTGNGRDLQLKNFSWKGMSGVGGYVENYNRWTKSAVRADITFTDHSFNVTSVKINQAQFYYQSSGGEQPFTVPSGTVIVKGLTDGQVLEYIYTDIKGRHVFTVKNDGIYTLPSFEFIAKWAYYGFRFNKVQESCNITIEQLPLYPGALVFDGVDDYGVCDNFPILTKEKGYTVVALRQWITRGEIAQGLVSNVKNWLRDGAFLLEYRNIQAEHLNKPISFGAIGSEMDLPHILTYQTSKSYNGVSITTGNFEGTDVLHVGKLAPTNVETCINAAIWELVFLDHDATEEELTKIKDYFVKTYPWLFPDQAWIVVGKTNEDEDRATIANITGNGNDLVLSNFGFAEGSGYGLYAYNFNSFSLRDNTVKPTDVKKDSFRIIGTGNRGNVLVLLNVSNSADWKICITGMKDGDHLLAGNANKSGDYIKITKDGVYTFQKQYAANATNGIWYNSSQEVDVLVEQIPEYEGYLVTDGVDDKIVSSVFGMGKDFTIVGDWKFIDNKNSGTGLVKGSSFYIYNTMIGLDLYINSGSVKNSLDGIKSINAACSDGRAYDRNWNEILANTGNVVGSGGTLEVSSSGGRFDRIAFKNLAIYPRILSKDECVKAYNYLQTLKAK